MIDQKIKEKLKKISSEINFHNNLYYNKDNPKIQRLVGRNDKIYSRSQEFISNPPTDLKIVQVAPNRELKCGVLSNSTEYIQDDYRYGLEFGLDNVNELRTKFC